MTVPALKQTACPGAGSTIQFSGAPHSAQNFAPSSSRTTAAPHTGQTPFFVAGFPHAGQNFAPSGNAAPQAAQRAWAAGSSAFGAGS